MVILLEMTGVVAFSTVVMLLWNGILPAVLHVGMITFWQAAGLLLLARILFGGFKGRRHYMGGGCHGRHRWENREKWAPQTVPQE